jgi:iron complex outermembrane receptor protein
MYYIEDRRVNTVIFTSPQNTTWAHEASQGTYLLDELSLDERWLLNGGVRGAWASYNFDETEQSPTKFERSDTTEGYEGGLGYKYNPDSKIFVNYEHSYRLPNLDEYFSFPYPAYPTSSINPSLTYQTGNQYQLGIKDKSFKNVNLGLTATEVQYKNEIYDDLIDPDAWYDFANYPGRTRHYSEEGDISVELFNKKIEPFANITFQQTEFMSGLYSGKQIPDVPDHLAHAGVTWRPLEGFSTSVTDNFVGKRYGIGDDENVYPKVKRYDTVDWNAKYNFRNYEIWVSLNNIFNAHYFIFGTSYDASVGGEAYYPAPGRNIAAGIKLKF